MTKIEFNIAITCASFDLPERLNELRENNFSEQEISTLQKSITYLTQACIVNPQTSIRSQFKSFRVWEAQRVKMKMLLMKEGFPEF